MLIKYGIKNNNIDVTHICCNKLIKNDIICIPECDFARSSYFGDPIDGILKSIFIINDVGETFEFDHKQTIHIDTKTGIITNYNDELFEKKLRILHSKLTIEFGNMNDEYPEQVMVIRYLTGNEKVLEIGGNIGRNSLVIGSILKEKNNKNFVSLESSSHISTLLEYNRDINNLNFSVESSALSKRQLIQKGWDTIESDVLLPGYTYVNTITLEELQSKYRIEFDTLVLDCEGAFYYILMDMPEILTNIKLIIMENDYWDIEKKKFVDDILIKNGFYADYKKAGGRGPCYNYFYEVWKK